jgi:hypothetical protein
VSMSISDSALLQDLKRRLEALEAERRPVARQPRSLEAYNAKRQADAERLRAEIERIAAESSPDQKLTAKRVLCILRRIHGDKAPSERTVRLHLERTRQRQRGAVLPT